MRGRRARRREAAARASKTARGLYQLQLLVGGPFLGARSAVRDAAAPPRASPLTRMRAGFAATVVPPLVSPPPPLAPPPRRRPPLARRALPLASASPTMSSSAAPPPGAADAPSTLRAYLARADHADVASMDEARFASWLAAEARARVLSDPGASLRAYARALRAHHAPTLDPRRVARRRRRTRARPPRVRARRTRGAAPRAPPRRRRRHRGVPPDARPGGTRRRGERRSQSRSDAPKVGRDARPRPRGGGGGDGRGTTPRRSFATVDEPPKRSPRRATRRAWRSRNATRRTRCAARGRGTSRGGAASRTSRRG